MTEDWQAFVLEHGWRALGHHLAQILGQPVHAINRVRRTRACTPLATGKTFPELFAKWHGRSPADDEWPAPRKIGGGYEWLGPERALLASLTGRVSTPETIRILTGRLQKITGDPTAARDIAAVAVGRQKIGLMTSDVVGGISAIAAGREIGRTGVVYHEIWAGHIKTVRIGRHVVIPFDEWERWKASRVFPPKGFILLGRLKRPLGIKSDKLSEMARLGYVPSAIRCNPYGMSAGSTKWGTWWIDPAVAKKLIADRKAGRPMPWWKKPEPWNLKATWTLLRQRQHPPTCATCRTIWGPAGPPMTYDDYARRYPPLELGAKRHLTRTWSDGLSTKDLAREVNLSVAVVNYAIRTGVLRAERRGTRYLVTRTDATRWKARNCPTGRGTHSWMQVPVACDVYGFTRREIFAHIKGGRLTSKVGEDGPQRGVRYVLKQQLRQLRETRGWPAAGAAQRLGVTVPKLRTLALQADWRLKGRYTLDVITTIQKRLESEEGLTIKAAARKLGKPVNWVEREIANGTARVLRTPFKARRRYLTGPMFARLQAAARSPRRRRHLESTEWILVGEAALLAGVSSTQVQRWADRHEVKTRSSRSFRYRRYHRRSVMARARQYWTSEVRFKRQDKRPSWMPATEAA